MTVIQHAILDDLLEMFPRATVVVKPYFSTSWPRSRRSASRSMGTPAGWRFVLRFGDIIKVTVVPRDDFVLVGARRAHRDKIELANPAHKDLLGDSIDKHVRLAQNALAEKEAERYREELNRQAQKLNEQAEEMRRHWFKTMRKS